MSSFFEKDNRTITDMKEVVPGAASLLEHLDKRIFVWLRDSHMFVGYLRSVDQFANLVMFEVSERIQLGEKCGDIPQGVMMVRGENVALLGEVEGENGNMQPIDELIATQVAKEEKNEIMHKLKSHAYWNRGLVYSAEDYF